MWTVIADPIAHKSCVQTQYALRILRAHGLSDSGLHAVFRSVAVAKIMYTSCTCSGLVNKRDEQRIDAFLRRNTNYGFCQPDLPFFKNSVTTAQQTSSSSIKFNKMSTTFSITYFIHPRPPHSATKLQSPDKTALAAVSTTHWTPH